MKIICRVRIVLCWLFVIAPFSRSAYATLGGNVDSIDSDSKTFSAERHSIKSEKNCDIHEISNSTLSIREFVSKQGTVFGLSWTGNRHPDLAVLLGKYYADFRKASEVKNRPHLRGAPRILKSDHLVIETFGHMRALRGRVCVPELIPENMSCHEIQ